MEAPCAQVSITSLPNELLYHTINHLNRSSDRYHVLLCSRRFRDIAHPLLYTHISLCWKGYDISACQLSKLRLLTLVMLRKPFLAAKVQHLTLRNERGIEHDRGTVLVKESEVERSQSNSLLEAAVWRLTSIHEQGKRWIEDLTSPYEDAMLSVLLAGLPNLKILDWRLRRESPWLEYFIENVALGNHPVIDQMPILQNLTDFVHIEPQYNHITEASYLCWILALPSIRAFYGFRVSGNYHDFELAVEGLTPKTSRLQHLELKGSVVYSEHLTIILQAPKELRTFIYELGDVDNDTNDNLCGIHEALEAQSESLEEIWLDYDTGPWDRHPQILQITCEPVGDFKAFKKLRGMKLAVVYLFGDEEEKDEPESSNETSFVDPWLYDFSSNFSKSYRRTSRRTISRPIFDLFPNSLESLSLLHAETYWDSTVEAVEGLLEKRRLDRKMLPNLVELIVSGPILAARRWWDTLASIRTDAFDQGIRFATVEAFYPIYYEKLANNWGRTFELSRERPWGFDSNLYWADCPRFKNRFPQFKEVEVPLTEEELAAMRALEKQRVLRNEGQEHPTPEKEKCRRPWVE